MSADLMPCRDRVQVRYRSVDRDVAETTLDRVVVQNVVDGLPAWECALAQGSGALIKVGAGRPRQTAWRPMRVVLS